MRQEVPQTTGSRGFQTAATVRTKLPSRTVLGGNSEKDAGGRGGRAVEF